MDPQLAMVFDAPWRDLHPESLCEPEEQALGEALRWGRGGARQVPELAAAAGVAPRRAQELMQHLLLKHRWPIGTSMSEPFGNYLIDSLQELEKTVSLLRVRGLSHLQRAAALKRMTLQEYVRTIQFDLALGRS